MNLMALFHRNPSDKRNNEDLRRERAAAQHAAAEARSRLLDELSKAVLNDLRRKPSS